MIKIPATRIVAAALLISSVTVAPLLDNDDVLTSPASDPVPTHNPQFRIQRQIGELSLTGHTSSLRHEQELLKIAESSYPDSRLVIEFQALGIVPEYWAESTVLVLKLLKDASSAEAIMAANALKIRCLVIDETAWPT